MGVCNCSMFCCTLLYVHSSIAIILMGKRELIALLNLSSWCLLMVEWLFLTVPRGSLQFVIVVFPDHTHLLFWLKCQVSKFNRSVYILIKLSELVAFDYGLSDSRDRLRCLRNGIYMLWLTSSPDDNYLGERYMVHGPSCFSLLSQQS